MNQKIGISFNFCFRSYHRCFELVTGFVIVLLIDMNQLQLFALDHYQLRFLDIFVFSFGLVSWEVLKFCYFFGTLDDIGLLLIDIGRLSDRQHLRFWCIDGNLWFYLHPLIIVD
ncbi:hypothetical protein RhiirA1_538228 [Rhizophagus irregularis]|uniref:Uncharacterized protein n=1 Tax=Rhizophagus irregularis TaxID=588596 RepID=A0A2N0RHM5_9GLOM|nr:hypothetical protein RhiirA1_538228 [Rhizophagus irregularis]